MRERDFIVTFLGLWLWLAGIQQPVYAQFTSITDGINFPMVALRPHSPVNRTANANGAAWLDLNSDGLEDLVVFYRGVPIEFYLNNGALGFSNVSPTQGDPGRATNDNVSGSVGYFANNNRWGVLIATSGIASTRLLYQNSPGNTNFTEQVPPNPIVSEGLNIYSVAWIDYDNDGHLDAHLLQGGSANHRMHRNNGDGSFSTVAVAALPGLLADTSMPAAPLPNIASWVDYNNDGWMDLFTTSLIGAHPHYLFRNNNGTSFSRRNITGLTTLNITGFGACWGDYNNDGLMDVCVLESAANGISVCRNNGGESFTRKPTETANVNTYAMSNPMASAWIDYDNDGFLDLVVGSGNGQLVLFRNNGGTFQPGVPLNYGTVANPPLASSMRFSGIVAADYNNDGFVDIFATIDHGSLPSTIAARNVLLRNDASSGNRYLKCKLTGVVSNTNAIGAAVRVRTGSQTQLRQIMPKTSTSSQESMVTHFGVGSTTTIDSIRINWPSGIIQRLANQSSNTTLNIIETIPSATFTSPASFADQNVLRGSTNHIIYELRAAQNPSDGRVNQLSFRTAGTYQPEDLQSIKLWYGLSPNFNNAQLLATETAIPASGGLVNFVDPTLSYQMGGYQYYYWITVDVSPAATPNRTIRLLAPTGADIGFVFGSPTLGSILNGGTHTIVSDPVTIAIASINLSEATVAQDTDNHPLYSFVIFPSGGTTNLTGLQIASEGTYQTSDLKANGFKLWYSPVNNFADTGQRVLLQSAVSVGSGSNIVFNTGSALPFSLAANTQAYFWITADIAPTAVIGRTLRLQALTAANVTFDFGTKNASTNPGATTTIVAPSDEIRLSALSVPAANVNTGTIQDILYRVRIQNQDFNTTLQSLSFRPTGTYQPADLVSGSFRLFINTIDNFGTATELSSQAITASGAVLLFGGLSQAIARNTEYFIWLTADVASSATVGRTIQVPAPALSDFSFASGTVVGTLTDAGIRTFVQGGDLTPAISLHTLPVAAADVVGGTNRHVIYQLRADVTIANATIISLSLPLRGDFSNTDLSRFELYFNTTDNFAGAVRIGERNPVGNGQNISFENINRGIAVNSSGYFWLSINLQSTATPERRIRVADLGNLTAVFAAGNVSNSLSDGNFHRFVAPPLEVVLNSVAIAAQDVLQGTLKHPIYQFTAEVRFQPTTLQRLNIPLGGNYIAEDIAPEGFRLWYNTTNNLGTATLIGSQSVVAIGQPLRFENLSLPLAANQTAHFWLTIDLSERAIVGNTIRAEAFGQNDINLSGVTPTLNLQAGGLQRFVEPVVVEVILPNFFSPNGDGRNDRFILRSRNISALDWRIFDRYGNLVFNTNDVSLATEQGWDGQDSPDGVYVWSIAITFNDGQQIRKSGEVKLAR